MRDCKSQLPIVKALFFRPEVWHRQKIRFVDDAGNEIRSSNRIMGTPVTVETLPPHVWQAIVAVEDKRFFEHGPIDVRSTIRAVFLNLFRGRFAAGGSTITQQTAKNIFLSRDKKLLVVLVFGTGWV